MPPSQLAPPALWEHYLVDNPWPLMVCLLVVGFVLLLVARNRMSRAWAIASGGAVVLAGVVYLCSRMIVTPRQQVMQATRELVEFTAPMDVAKVWPLLDPKAAVYFGQAPKGNPWMTREELDDRLTSAAGRKMIVKQHIVSLEADTPARDEGRALVRLTTTANPTGEAEFPAGSTWLLMWSRGVDGVWRVTELRCVSLSVGGVPLPSAPEIPK